VRLSFTWKKNKYTRVRVVGISIGVSFGIGIASFGEGGEGSTKPNLAERTLASHFQYQNAPQSYLLA